ncbi:protein sprint-like isoform X3 [Stegodyphus dumicola]|uniref:protein sprint-like isoform X3 n=1 Tax=Stegodyphus dumicola TaxID=202533 RepID=UPI0015B22955|nr:protein sprint-like isoform X3 [Stegodyphus dumicola]
MEGSAVLVSLISGVAHDLDLMLQDLFPDAIPSPLREEYGLTDDIALDHESFANHATLLEQFMRGAGPDTSFLGAEDPSGEYRSSKSLFAETPTSDSCDGRTTPTSTSSPSPPPPAPPPRSVPPPLHYPADYSAHLQGMQASSSVGAQSAMVSSSSVSSVQETSDGDSSHTSSSFAPCDIGLLERLIRTHPIWFLPGIGRAGAVHLLQGKDVGNFIVRQSSKPNTMALSVRLPENKGPYVEHYLIETVGDAQLRLEGSDNNFHAIPMLVAHYCQCCDELPVQLALPSPLAQAGSRQELSSLALLGQDFWLSSLVHSPASAPPAGPFPSLGVTENISTHSTFKPGASAVVLHTGPSPPSTLGLTSAEKPPDISSPSSSSPPPPVAPKHQSHGTPPPPPPRSFMTSRTSSCANIPAPQPPGSSETSPDLSSPSSNNDTKSQSTNSVTIEKSDVKLKTEESETKKGEKKIPRVAHYKQSNIADLSPAYYKSSLADKISDYEDIWGNTITKDGERKPKLKTFQSTVNDEPSYEIKHKSYDFSKKQQSAANLCYTQGTQTEVLSTNTFEIPLNDIQNHISISAESSFDKDDSSPEDRENFSSPFYSEPVDSLPLETNNQRTSSFGGVEHLPQRLFNHRFSDPNLHWPQNASCRKIESTLDEERLASLSSSVDNIKGLGPSPQHRKNIALSTHWVQELNQRIASQSAKKDCQTQVSVHDLLSQKCEKKSSSPKKGKGRLQSNTAWPLDSSWEWMAHDDSSSDDNDIMSMPGTLDSKFPLHIPYKDADSQLGDTTTVEDLIALRSPELALPDIRPLTQSNLMRVSEYDNLDRPPDLNKDIIDRQRVSEIADDTATEFCEPWDSLRWERLLRLVLPETDILGDDDTLQREKMENQRNYVIENNKKNDIGKSENIPQHVGFEDNESNSTVSAYSDATSEGIDDTSASEYPTVGSERYRNKSFEERLEPLLAAQRVVALRNRSTSRIGENIRHYIFRLAEERDNTFAKSIEHFIQCTKESNETKPAVVMRNIRQFMSGIKNYLLKHGEGRFENLLQEERSKLRSDEFLDIDAVIEDSLHKLVIKPLKGYIYQLFVNEYTRNGSLKLLSDNIKFARTKTPEELGVRPEFKLPEGTSLEVVNHFLNRLQQAYSPLKKLENLLAAISTIYNSVQQDKIAQGKEHVSLGAGDFLPIFICVLVRCGLIAAEIEADYMWGLLHPSLMAREGGYYLTTLSSAVHVLKSLQACSPESPQHSVESFDNLAGCSGRGYSADIGSPKSQLSCKTPSPEPRLACIADLQGFLKIMIPDELTGSIISKTLPIKPNMTTKEVAKLIAHKFNVTNPQDYCLFKLVDGEETMLGDSECPQVIKADLMAAGSNCLFTYKRCDAKFIWPIMEKSS